MSDEKPQEKPTTPFEAPPKWAEGMFARVFEGQAAMEARIGTRLEEQEAHVNKRMDVQDEKLDSCISGLKTVNGAHEDLKRDFHQFKGETAARFETHSIRAKQESISDEETRQEVKAIKAELSESQFSRLLATAAKTPIGSKIMFGLGGLALTAIGYATVRVERRMSDMQEHPTPAATVYIVGMPDGGAR